MDVSVHTHTENELANGGLTPGRNSRRQRHPRALDDEELFIIEGSPAATGAQLWDNPEEREKCGKMRKKALHMTSPCRRSEAVARPNGFVGNSGTSCMTAGNIDHPVRVLHLRYFSSFLHCPDHQAPVVVQQRVSQPVKEMHLKNLDGLLHSLHCVPVSDEATATHHSVEDLKLRHLRVLDENLLERSCVVTETPTTASATIAAASICIPPWPGGVDLLK